MPENNCSIRSVVISLKRVTARRCCEFDTEFWSFFFFCVPRIFPHQHCLLSRAPLVPLSPALYCSLLFLLTPGCNPQGLIIDQCVQRSERNVTEFATFIHCGRSSANARIGGLLTDMLLVMGNPGRLRELSALIASAAILLLLSALPICRPYTYEQDGMQHPFFFAATIFQDSIFVRWSGYITHIAMGSKDHAGSQIEIVCVLCLQ